MANPSNRTTAIPSPVQHDPRIASRRQAPRPGDVRTGVVPSHPETGDLSSGTGAAPQTAIGAERPPEAREARGSGATGSDPLGQRAPAETSAMQAHPGKRAATPLRIGVVVLAVVVLALIAVFAV